MQEFDVIITEEFKNLQEQTKDGIYHTKEYKNRAIDDSIKPKDIHESQDTSAIYKDELQVIKLGETMASTKRVNL